MSLLSLPSRLDERHATIYLAVGVLAALKAVALRDDRRRFRRELREAALFLGLGLVLRTYHGRRSTGDDQEGEDDPAEASDAEPEVAADADPRSRLERTARRLVPSA